MILLYLSIEGTYDTPIIIALLLPLPGVEIIAWLPAELDSTLIIEVNVLLY